MLTFKLLNFEFFIRLQIQQLLTNYQILRMSGLYLRMIFTFNNKTGSFKIGLYAAIVAFFTYTLIFGFRKSFTVCTFDGISFWGLGYKTLLVLSQMVGYLMAKFYGIKFIAELKRFDRYKIIFLLVGIAWLAWLLFALVPAPYNIVFLLINGFPLGMLWGVVFSYIEGRKSTDFIGAALAVSFIFSSGFVKSVGGWLMVHFKVSEFWIPFTTGLVFALPLLVLVFLMEQIPPPTQGDIDLRMNRSPMSAAERGAFIKNFLPGIIAIVVIYMFATIFRDIRDNFSADMWKEMGFLNKPALFSASETPITLIILVLIGSMVLIKNNFTALMISHVLILMGFVIAGLSTYLFRENHLSPMLWMILVGIGLYMVYIPFNAVYFERLIASFKYSGNVGFLIYVADSFGYIGSVGVLLSKEIFKVQLNWVSFFSNSVMVLSIAGFFITLFASRYFYKKFKTI